MGRGTWARISSAVIHRLCNLGGTVESLAPEVKDLTRTEFLTELMEHIFSLSAVQRAVRHMEMVWPSWLRVRRQRYRPMPVARLVQPAQLAAGVAPLEDPGAGPAGAMPRPVVLDDQGLGLSRA